MILCGMGGGVGAKILSLDFGRSVMGITCARDFLPPLLGTTILSHIAGSSQEKEGGREEGGMVYVIAY